MVRKSEVSLPHSNIKESVARLLKESNFIDDVRVSDARVGKTLVIRINGEDSNARITEIVRLSKPGRRYYVNSKEIPVVKRGRGVVIVSTSKGLMTGQQARNEKVGGELICKVY
jgi:small subunit ribosomal protein S8